MDYFIIFTYVLETLENRIILHLCYVFFHLHLKYE